jgi:hypothetical protein
MERLDHSFLHPLIRHPRQTCLGRESNPDTKSSINSLLLSITNLYKTHGICDWGARFSRETLPVILRNGSYDIRQFRNASADQLSNGLYWYCSYAI